MGLADRLLAPSSSPQRFAAVVGAALMVVGVAHLAVWLVVGGGWAGPVSFRKPTTLGSGALVVARPARRR